MSQSSKFILFTRLPIAGHTKTRLQSHLSENKCAELHECFIKDELQCAFSVFDEIYVAYSSPYPVPQNYIDEVFNVHKKSENLQIFEQVGEGLNERMMNAIIKCAEENPSSHVILAGCDIPELSEKILMQVKESVEKCDIFVVPTYDGGYCLIAINAKFIAKFISGINLNPAFQIIPEMNLNERSKIIPELNFNEMTNKIDGIEVDLPFYFPNDAKIIKSEKLHDIDLMNDLIALNYRCKNAFCGATTKQWLKAYFEK